MFRRHKTSKSNRTTYTYFAADESRVILTPGTNDVTEADISLLHRLDDLDYNNDRRHEERHARFEDSTDDDGEFQADKLAFLADIGSNPADIVQAKFDETEAARLIERLPAAISRLQPQQQSLIRRVFFDGCPPARIAAEEGVSRAAISIRLKKIYGQLQRFLENGA